MGFSCTIYQGKKKITSGENSIVHDRFNGLGPSGPDQTDAPYRLEEMRSMVANYPYKNSHKQAAIDCFTELQRMAIANLESLEPYHCETCDCDPVKPKGWSVDSINNLLAVDPNSITKITGGY